MVLANPMYALMPCPKRSLSHTHTHKYTHIHTSTHTHTYTHAHTSMSAGGMMVGSLGSDTSGTDSATPKVGSAPAAAPPRKAQVASKGGGKEKGRRK